MPLEPFEDVVLVQFSPGLIIHSQSAINTYDIDILGVWSSPEIYIELVLL